MKRALLVGVLGAWAAVAGVMSCVGSSFVETGSGGSTGSTTSTGTGGGAGSSTTQSSSGATTSSGQSSTSSSGMGTSTSSGSSTASSSSSSSGNPAGCPSSEPAVGSTCDFDSIHPLTCMYPNPRGTCCADDTATCKSNGWQDLPGSCCPSSPPQDTSSCGCYPKEVCDYDPCADGGAYRQLATCDTVMWTVPPSHECTSSMFACADQTCFVTGEVCVMAPDGDAGVRGQCVPGNLGCVMGAPASCLCALPATVCLPEYVCTMVSGDTTTGVTVTCGN